MFHKKIVLALILLGATQTVIGTKTTKYYNLTGKKPYTPSQKTPLAAAISKIDKIEKGKKNTLEKRASNEKNKKTNKNKSKNKK